MTSLVLWLALRLKPVIAERAKENNRLGADMTNTGLQNSVKAVNTQQEIAKAAGVSHDTIAKVSPPRIIKKYTPWATGEQADAIPDAAIIGGVCNYLWAFSQFIFSSFCFSAAKAISALIRFVLS